MVKDNQYTIRFHVDELLSSQIDSKLKDLFLKWLNRIYGTYVEVKATRDKVHGYIVININFSDAGKVKIDMVYYIRNMIYECTKKITGK